MTDSGTAPTAPEATEHTPASPLITGYRPLDSTVIAHVNEIKRLEQTVADLYRRLDEELDLDPRWVRIARTHLEQGFMTWIRALTQPVSPFEAPSADVDTASAAPAGVASPTRSRRA